MTFCRNRYFHMRLILREKKLVQSAGLEPATYRFEAGNSIH